MVETSEPWETEGTERVRTADRQSLTCYIHRHSSGLEYCYEFAWQGFGSGGAIGVASVRCCEKLPPCLIKPVSVS